MVVECKPEKAYKNLILFLEPCEEQGELLRYQKHSCSPETARYQAQNKRKS
jgi:hypothetical protein